MGHDEHFLQRLDRVPREHVELALGLYRDHELVRFLLSHARAAEGAERVAIALDDSEQPPHVVVARTGAFVTCLGSAMSTGTLPIVTRAQLDGIAARFERVREGLEIAKKRGVDAARLLERLRKGGRSVAREELLAACSVLGPAGPLLFSVYASWVRTVEELRPLLAVAFSKDPRADRAKRELTRAVWSLAHSATVLVDCATREWVREWSEIPNHTEGSPWTALTGQCGLAFVVRAAWLAGRMGKPMLASYKARFLSPRDPIELREAGWGLVAMALRHAALRAEVFRFLRSPPAPSGNPALDGSYILFDEAAKLYDEKEEALREEGRAFGRNLVVAQASGVDPSSAYHFTDPAQVPDEIALPALFEMVYDAHNGDRGGDLTLIAMAVAAQARAEDFYFPAAALRALPADDDLEVGGILVEAHRKLVGVPKTVRVGEQPGRNAPCPCGSGKKYKRCHGA